MYSRPIIKWLLFTACVAVLLTAMAWMTRRMLQMDHDRAASERTGQMQERVRLALWRMDSLVSALLVRENARPPEHYQPFQTPRDLFFKGSQKEVPKGEALLASPLLGESPEFVLLHFELIDGRTCSPQVPITDELNLANNFYTISAQLNAARQRLVRLDALVHQHRDLLTSKATPLTTNIDAPTSNALSLTERSELAKQTLATSREMQERARVVQNSAAAQSQAPAKKEANEPRRARAPSELRPVWAGNELLLLRYATVDDVTRLQGLWLDWTLLRGRLLESIRDLLPYARLNAIDLSKLDASSLVTLPVRLETGPLDLDINEDSFLKRMLLIAWSCFAIAAAAVGLVLHRAISLSERRGAFVSAVTHELRTPLTTFRLYSEMLADGMVTDPEQRRAYLNTLCDESTRLTHLVENVLAYSRIERGRTAARMERVDVKTLINRIEPRLRQRASQAQLDLQVTLPADADQLMLAVDVLAVEQILFNLVDNAGKYAAPQCDPRTLHLDVTSEDDRLFFYVLDHGPGLPAGQMKRLFRPFEKSATEAAHSAPGVGLGLALSRQLARELKGELELVPVDHGACFVLTLPRAIAESEPV
jgi:signal transduction histidine kinase